MQKNIFIIILVAALAFFAYKTYAKPKTHSTDPLDDGSKGDNKQKEPIKNTRGDSFPLSQGASGARVRTLQTKILELGGRLPRWGVDGIWGNETQDALHFLKLPLIFDANAFDILSRMQRTEVNKALTKSGSNVGDLFSNLISKFGQVARF